MAGGFKIIIYTLPDFIDKEADALNTFGESELVDFIHVRKPQAKCREIRDLLLSLTSDTLRKVKLHSSFSLFDEFDLHGVHVNSRCHVAPPNCSYVSRSCHTIAELAELSSYEYVTLSPIYDSISKKGYSSEFCLDEIRNNITNKPIVALGGVRPCNFRELSEAGFYGAAMLGYAWSANPEDILMEIEMELGRLQVSHDTN